MAAKKKPRPRSSKAEAGVWFPIGSRNHFDVCCDCGLVHRNEFSIVIEAVSANNMRPVVKLFGRAWRDNRATAAKRAHKRKRGEPVASDA